MAKQFAVIGLGRFGSSLASTLAKMGHEVLAVDIDEDRVRELASTVTQAVQADATDEEALRDLGIKNFDVVVVAMKAFEPSLLVTLFLKQMGVAKVIVKAAGEVHGRILEKIGADTIVFPEKDMGERLAYSLVSGSVIDHIELSDDISVVEIVVTGALSGRTLRDLNLRNRMGLTVVAIKRNKNVNVFVSPDEPLHEGDILVAVGPNEGVQKLSKLAERG
ncbi:MAG: TrkA family potassium uptake protein [Bacillota bacterium]